MSQRRQLFANPRRLVGSLAYFGFARHLPWSPRPGGPFGKRMRRRCAELMLDQCGRDVNVEHGAFFGSGVGVELGDRSDIGLDALCMGPITIGADVMMGPRCVLLASNHETASIAIPMNRQGFALDRRIVIEDDVWLGANVTVVAGRRIGRGSIVAAGAVVTTDIPPWSLAVGNPATVRRDRRATPARPSEDARATELDGRD